jgi:hypothetical protein
MRDACMAGGGGRIFVRDGHEGAGRADGASRQAHGWCGGASVSER